MGKFLFAENHNWSMRESSDWDGTSFDLSYDGELHIIVTYWKPIVDCVVKMTTKDLNKIKSLIPTEQIPERIDAFDGEAWSFDAYDELGNVIFHRNMCYTYGIKPLEKIQAILRSYIPQYTVPEFDGEPSYYGTDVEGFREMLRKVRGTKGSKETRVEEE